MSRVGLALARAAGVFVIVIFLLTPARVLANQAGESGAGTGDGCRTAERR